MSFVPVEKPRFTPSEPTGQEPGEESPMAIAGFIFALVGAVVSVSIFLMYLPGPPWIVENLGTFALINRIGVVIAVVGTVLSIAALFHPPRRLGIAGVIVGLIGSGAVILNTSTEPPIVAENPAPTPTPSPSPKPKPKEKTKEEKEEDQRRELMQLPDSDDPPGELREWTTMDGKRQVGKFTKVEQGKVLIELGDKSTSAIEYKQLVPRDQRWVIKQNAPAPEKKPEETFDPKRENYRNFATIEGDVFAAKFISRSGDRVTFEYEDGRQFQFPFRGLSDADQAYIKKRSGM